MAGPSGKLFKEDPKLQKKQLENRNGSDALAPASYGYVALAALTRKDNARQP
jgi:hypothetical protein